MKDGNRGSRRGATMMLVSLAAAVGALSVSNLSCGKVSNDACAQSACPEIAALEARVMELEQKVQPLLAIAQLQCTGGQLLAWSGASWECIGQYTDARAVAANADLYVPKTGDSTITGSLTVTQEVIVTSGLLRFNTTPLRYSRATISRSGDTISYYEAGNSTPVDSIDISGAASGGGLNKFIRYEPGSSSTETKLFFNIERLSSSRCALMHADDDRVVYGLAFATDSSGNQHAGMWGATDKPTAELSRQGVNTKDVIASGASYSIACF